MYTYTEIYNYLKLSNKFFCDSKTIIFRSHPFRKYVTCIITQLSHRQSNARAIILSYFDMRDEYFRHVRSKQENF